MLKFGALLISLLYLLGCASSVKTVSKVAEVIYDPDIQVGANDVQPSTFSVAALTDNANTTVSETLKRSIFSFKGPKDRYLIKFFEVDKKAGDLAVEGVLNIDQVSPILDGDNEAEHAYYLKTNGYKFIQHLALTEDVHYLMAAVYFEEPKCTVWSPLKAVKSIGEEYNFYFKATERYFLFQSDLELSSPGEATQLNNRFVGECFDQFNALDGRVLSKIEATDEVKYSSISKEKVVEEYPSASLVTVPVNEKKLMTKKDVVKDKPKNTKDIIDALIDKNIKEMVLSPDELRKLPSYVDDSDNVIYLVSGTGVVSTASNALNIRKAPGESNDRMALIAKGQFVQIQRFTPDKQGWLFIESEGIKPGWVSEKLVNWKKL